MVRRRGQGDVETRKLKSTSEASMLASNRSKQVARRDAGCMARDAASRSL